DDKVLEHYAIIPTELVPNLDDLSTDEELIYTTVTKRTLLMFSSDYHYQSTQVLLTNGNQTFKATGTVTKSLGWRSYVSIKAEDKEIPAYQEGQKIAVLPKQVKRMTKPPTRISESILLKKLLPKYNLGTSATRDGMIDLIQRKGYVTKDKKTGQFFPTERGRQLI
ncbi:DNA topoisomerase, partial [Streptococcus suis]